MGAARRLEDPKRVVGAIVGGVARLTVEGDDGAARGTLVVRGTGVEDGVRLR